MELVTCALCGNLFNTIDKKICPLCAKKEEEYFTTVKKFLKENPSLTFKRIVQDTGVPERLLRKWIKDGKLEIVNKEGIGIRCERCNKEILQGKYCVECRGIIQNGLNDLIKEERKMPQKKESGTKMRFLEK